MSDVKPEGAGIDHKAEAAEGARTIPIQSDMPAPEIANWIALHQLQATLALVEAQERAAEQLRIGNLIAYHGHVINMPRAIKASVEKGLGL